MKTKKRGNAYETWHSSQIMNSRTRLFFKSGGQELWQISFTFRDDPTRGASSLNIESLFGALWLSHLLSSTQDFSCLAGRDTARGKWAQRWSGKYLFVSRLIRLVLNIIMSISIYLFIVLSIYLSVYLSICLSICLSIHPSIHPKSIHPSIHPSIH